MLLFISYIKSGIYEKKVWSWELKRRERGKKKHLFIIILFQPDLLAYLFFFLLFPHVSFSLWLSWLLLLRVSTIYERVAVLLRLPTFFFHNTEPERAQPACFAPLLLFYSLLPLLHSYDNKKNWIIFLVHFKTLTKAHRRRCVENFLPFCVERKQFSSCCTDRYSGVEVESRCCRMRNSIFIGKS